MESLVRCIALAGQSCSFYKIVKLQIKHEIRCLELSFGNSDLLTGNVSYVKLNTLQQCENASTLTYILHSIKEYVIGLTLSSDWLHFHPFIPEYRK